jgi:dTDP-4-dehydrorhamnose reductase
VNTADKKIIVTGAVGLLGSHLLYRLDGCYNIVGLSRNSPINSNYETVSFDILDIADFGALNELLDRESCKTIINCAALSDVDRCETEREPAHQINTEVAALLARRCRESGSLLIHISTDYIFDGLAGPYAEDAPTHPINYYGATKLEAEKAVQDSGCEHIIVRTNHLYGNLLQGPSKLIRWLLSAKEKAISAAADQYNNPTWAGNLADVIVELIECDFRGIINVGGPDYLSRYKFAIQAARIFSIDGALIKNVPFEQLNMVAPRPLRAGLTIDRMGHILRTKAVGVLEGLEKVRAGAL